MFKILFLSLIVASIIFLEVRWDMASYFKPSNIESWLDDAGALAPLLFIGAMTAAIVVSPIPSLPLSVAAGAYFGPWFGTVYSVVGATAGATLSFLIARLLGREFVERYLGGHVNFCEQCSDKILSKIVFLSRLLPVVSFDLVSYGAGLTKMSIGKFVVATSLGMVPVTFLYNYSGSVLAVGKELALALGILMVLLFFIIPKWLEEKGLLEKMTKHK